MQENNDEVQKKMKANHTMVKAAHAKAQKAGRSAKVTFVSPNGGHESGEHRGFMQISGRTHAKIAMKDNTSRAVPLHHIVSAS